jgi:hypothetical protein
MVQGVWGNGRKMGLVAKHYNYQKVKFSIKTWIFTPPLDPNLTIICIPKMT